MQKLHKEINGMQERPGIINRTLNAIAYPVSLAVGWVYAHISARNSLYDTVKYNDEFHKPIRQPHWDNVKNILSKHGNVAAEIAQEHAKFSRETTQFFKSRGFHNTFDYFKGISSQQKLDSVMSFFTAAGISLGVMLTIADNKSLFERFTRRQRQDSGGDIQK